MHTCPICKRELGNVNVDKHHLVPKTFKGRELVSLHRICHEKIHRTFTEKELANYYNTVERILEHEEIQKFVKWISKKPNDFYSGTIETNIRYGKRRK